MAIKKNNNVQKTTKPFIIVYYILVLLSALSISLYGITEKLQYLILFFILGIIWVVVVIFKKSHFKVTQKIPFFIGISLLCFSAAFGFIYFILTGEKEMLWISLILIVFVIIGLKTARIR